LKVLALGRLTRKHVWSGMCASPDTVTHASHPTVLRQREQQPASVSFA
jgi:hypothetical protein